MPATARRSAIATDPGILDDHQLLAGLRALRRGDFAFRLPADKVGIAGEIAEAFNAAAEVHQRMSREFDRFYRGRNVVGRIQGTGIGLAGARQIVEQHGGRVSVASKEHEGTTITMRIPLGQG